MYIKVVKFLNCPLTGKCWERYFSCKLGCFLPWKWPWIGQRFHSETFPRQTSVLTYKYSIDNPTIMMLMSLEKLSKVRKLMFCATRSGHLYSYQIRTSLKFLQYKQINFEFVWPTSLVLNMGYARQIISMRETVFTRVKLLIKHL